MDILLLTIIHLNQFGQYNMLDTSHIPSQQQSTFTFYATGNWQTWQKPRNAKMIEIFCLGGGGGGGHCTIAGGGSIGAGGGSSGGITRGIIPAFLLPDTLFIFVGKRGLGGIVSGGAGGDGSISYVSVTPTVVEQTLICKSSTTAGNGGSGTGTGGTAPTIATTSLSAFGNLGLFTAIAGVAGSSSNAGSTPGTSQAALGSNIITGGAGGGGKTSVGTFGTGGNISSASAVLTTQVNGGVAAGENGANGYGTLIPFCGTGGAGGAGIFGGGTGGKGGKGFYGCGGGGGGGGNVVGSNGGDGGDGLVKITVIT
jgi:hypothetical protein